MYQMKKVRLGHRIVVKLLGIFYILIGLTAIFYSLIVLKNVDQMFWYCYFAMIIMGIGLFIHDSSLIASQINYLFFPFLIWNLDFFYELVTGVPLFGITSYMFEPSHIIPKIISFQHVFTIPVAIYFLAVFKLKRKTTWVFTIVQASIIYLISASLTHPANNINCVFRSCIPFIHAQIIYPFLWVIITFVMVLVTNYLLVKLFYRKN